MAGDSEEGFNRPHCHQPDLGVLHPAKQPNNRCGQPAGPSRATSLEQPLCTPRIPVFYYAR